MSDFAAPARSRNEVDFAQHVQNDPPYKAITDIQAEGVVINKAVRRFINFKASGSASPLFLDDGQNDRVNITVAVTNTLGAGSLTSNKAVTATTEATATEIVAATVTTDLLVELDFYGFYKGDNAALSICLYRDGASVGVWTPTALGAVPMPVRLFARFSESAGSHTYSVRGFVAAGTATIQAGAGGVGVAMPCWLAVRKGF